MKLKRTSRRLVRRIALGLAVAAVAAPSAGAMYGLPMTGYKGDAVKTAALTHAYKVWNQDRVTNGGDEVASALADFYRVLPSALAGGQATTADRNYNLIPQYVLDEFGPSSRPAPGVRAFFGPIGQVSQPVPGGNGPIVPISRPESGALIPNDLSGRQFGPAALPTESTPVTAPDSRFGPGRVLPVASTGEEFTWDDATIGIVAGLGTALLAALAGIAVMGRRDRLARA
jgi:hypothetical protein